MKACLHHTECGGCRYGDVSYADQIAAKHADFLAQMPEGVRHVIHPILTSPHSEYHRNKMEYSFFTDSDGRVKLGLKKQGRFDQSVETPHCRLFDHRWPEVWQWIVETVATTGWTAYHPKTHVGVLRYCVVRKSEHHQSWLVNWVVAADIQEELTPLAEEMRRRFHWISGVVMSVQSTLSDTAYTQDVRLLDGEMTFLEAIGSWKFRVSPYSFFQTNSKHVGTLYGVAKALAQPTPNERMLDLYCGASTIGIFFSDSVKSVLGVEENPSAILDGHFNCKLNGVTNIELRQGKVKNILKFETPQAELVIVDPPRSGLEPKALRRSAAVGASRIVYVSCNPKTLAIDLPMLDSEGYVATHIQPVDMFPHSTHLEAVVLLEKKR